jgi:hypothetical protein
MSDINNFWLEKEWKLDEIISLRNIEYSCKLAVVLQ